MPSKMRTWLNVVNLARRRLGLGEYWSRKNIGSVGIVIPALNEELSVGAVVAACAPYGLPIVVDDGSYDQTSSEAIAAGAQVVRHSKNRGYDNALESGFQMAKRLGCKFVITCDSDAQHSPSDLDNFVSSLDGGYDVVSGIRDRKQRISERIFALVTVKLYGLSDPLCGMKGYRIEIFDDLGYFDSYKSIGTELLLHALMTGKKISQVPIQSLDRVGNSRFGATLGGNYKILRSLFIHLIKKRVKISDHKFG